MGTMDILGNGIYSVPETCKYLRANPNRIYSWFREGNIFKSDYNEIDGQKSISFLDLIDAKVALIFRENDVPMRELKNAYAALQEQTGRLHPFAHNDLFFHDGKIFRQEISPNHTPLLYRVISKQGYIDEVMHPFLTKVDFDRDSKVALRWRIAPGIVIDPQMRFGAPVIESTRIPAETLAQCYSAHDNDATTVTHLFPVTKTQVQNAVDFVRKYYKAA